MESTIHFPTDLNLLWDSARKCLDTVNAILANHSLEGWRKRKYWYKTIKKDHREAANIHQKKGKDYQKRLGEAAEKYLSHSRDLSLMVEHSRKEIAPAALSDMVLASLLKDLTYYHQMLDKHIGLVERRIIKGEAIPHAEKIFSIFEPHTEWIQKGKHGKAVELGHNALLTTDQFQFIVDHGVLVGKGDKAQPIPLAGRLKKRFAADYVLGSISFDRGFYSLLAKKALQKEFGEVVMPKNSKKTLQQEIEEEAKTFVALRKKHSAVESNINELEHGGVNRVPDKGLEGFKKYVAMGVLAYNLKRLGKMVMQEQLLPTVVMPGKLRMAA